MGKINPYRDPRFTYVQVAEKIAARIKSGEITDRLPAERALEKEYGVAYQTVRHSIKTLREDGVIYTRQGRGSFVKPTPGSDDDDADVEDEDGDD